MTTTTMTMTGVPSVQVNPHLPPRRASQARVEGRLAVARARQQRVAVHQAQAGARLRPLTSGRPPLHHPVLLRYDPVDAPRSSNLLRPSQLPQRHPQRHPSNAPAAPRLRPNPPIVRSARPVEHRNLLSSEMMVCRFGAPARLQNRRASHDDARSVMPSMSCSPLVRRSISIPLSPPPRSAPSSAIQIGACSHDCRPRAGVSSSPSTSSVMPSAEPSRVYAVYDGGNLLSSLHCGSAG